MRNRPQLITTVSQDMYDLLQREKARDSRPMSFVVDEALHVWAKFLGWKLGETHEVDE
jgi:hypothetical protein